MALVALLALLVVHPWDHEVINYVKQNEDPTLKRMAQSLGWWGDFAQYNLTGFLALWLFGTIFKKRWFQRLAVATFLAALFAGLSVNSLRFTTGRPRPHANLEDKFHGIPGVLSGWEYHGFPSGHTSTAMGMGVPVVTAAGIYGAPVILFSSSVGLSRIYQKKHYPTDVIIGGAFGIVYGCASGWHLRKVRLRLRKRRQRSKNRLTSRSPLYPVDLLADSTKT